MREVSLADPRHLMRYLKNQAGTPVADIAKAEHVKVEAVRASIVQVERFRKKNAQPEMELAVRDFVISASTKAKKSFEGLLDATELVEVKDLTTGIVRHERMPDKTTRLEAVRIYKDVIIGMQPKQSPVAVNVQQTNQVANLSSTETTEERMRRLREQARAHNALPPEVVAVPAHIDEGDEDDDEGDEEDGE